MLVESPQNAQLVHSSRSELFPSYRKETTIKFVSGLYHSKEDHLEYLVSEFSMMVLKGGESYSSSDFRFDINSRHVVARALNCVFDFYFSVDWEYIESGTCRNLITFVTTTYGPGPQQLHFQRSNNKHFASLGKASLLSEPTLYYVHGDQSAFIFSDTSFVVLMDGKEYVSSTFKFDKTTRHVQARAHHWRFDFAFSKDYMYVEQGSYYNVQSGETLHMGSAVGQLFFEKDEVGKYSVRVFLNNALRTHVHINIVFLTCFYYIGV